MPEQKYIVLSDLHLGDGSAADDFGPAGGAADMAMIAKCRDWKARGYRVILAGDIFDLWQTRLYDAIAAHREAVEALFDLVDVYVAGNHDDMLLGAQVFDVLVVPWAVVDGIYVEHGHNHDPIVSRFPRLSRAVCWIGGIAERVIHHDVDVWAERLCAWIGGTGRHGANKKYWDLVANRAFEKGCNQVVFGHTHSPGEIYIYPSYGVYIRVYNAGTWTNGRRDFVEV
jgi:hypothetical protein